MENENLSKKFTINKRNRNLVIEEHAKNRDINKNGEHRRP